jgi:hypothetical protein
MFGVVRLAITPITGPSFCVGDGDDVDSIAAVAKDILKWELLNTARAMPIVNAREPFRIGLNARQCNVDRDTEIMRGAGPKASADFGRGARGLGTSG